MKNLCLKLSALLLVLLSTNFLPNEANAQVIVPLGTIDGCCVEVWYKTSHEGNTWTLYPDISNPSVVYYGSDADDDFDIVDYCPSGNGTYTALFEVVKANGETVTYTDEYVINDCANCWTNEVVSPSGCPLGSYTLCCDGSLTIQSTKKVTYVKIFNTAGCTSYQGCILCGYWSGPVCNSNNNSWSYEPGTVTANNNIYIEFQSNSPWDSFDCDWNSGPINLSDQINQNCNIYLDEEAISTRETPANEVLDQPLEVAISPNPATNHLNINTTSNSIQEITIFSISGKQIVSQKMQGNINRMDISMLSAGLYFINVLDEVSGSLHTEKIVIID